MRSPPSTLFFRVVVVPSSLRACGVNIERQGMSWKNARKRVLLSTLFVLICPSLIPSDLKRICDPTPRFSSSSSQLFASFSLLSFHLLTSFTSFRGLRFHSLYLITGQLFLVILLIRASFYDHLKMPRLPTLLVILWSKPAEERSAFSTCAVGLRRQGLSEDVSRNKFFDEDLLARIEHMGIDLNSYI